MAVNVNVRDLPWNLLGVCRWNFFLPYIHLSLKSPQWEQSASQGEWIKETGKRTCRPWILPRYKIWRRDHTSLQFVRRYCVKKFAADFNFCEKTAFLLRLVQDPARSKWPALTSSYEGSNSGYAIKPKKKVKRQADTDRQWNTSQK